MNSVYCLILLQISSEARNAQVTFAEKSLYENKHFLKTKTWISKSYTWSDKAFKGIVRCKLNIPLYQLRINWKNVYNPINKIFQEDVFRHGDGNQYWRNILPQQRRNRYFSSLFAEEAKYLQQGFTEFRNWENVPLNKDFLEFETVW